MARSPLTLTGHSPTRQRPILVGPTASRITRYDGVANSTVATVTLNVADNTPPDVTNPGAQTSTEGDTVSLQIVAVDPEDAALNYTATGLPLGLSIGTSTGLITGTVVSTFTQHGPYSVTVSAKDTAGNTGSASFTWTVTNVAPTVVNRTYGVAKNTPLFVNAATGVLVGSSDPGGETIQAVANVLPTHGTLVTQQRWIVHVHADDGLFWPGQLHLSRV